MNEIRETILPFTTTATTNDTHARRSRANSQPAANVANVDAYTGPVTRSHTKPHASDPALPVAQVDAPLPGIPRPSAPVAPAPIPPAPIPPAPVPPAQVPTAASRQLQLQRPIVAFDLETTGLNRHRDAIIEWGAVKQWPSGQREEHLFRIRPRVPVQPAAERIHGISNAALALCEPLEQVAPKIADIVRDADLLGHNAQAFDLPFLTIELKRVGLDACLQGAHVVDTLKTFRKAVPRGQGTDNHRLGTAYQYYLGKPLQGAHGALADARASLDVLHAQLARHPDLPNTVAALEAIEEQP